MSDAIEILKITIFEMNNLLTRQSLDYTPNKNDAQLGFKLCWAKPLVHNSPAYGDLMRPAWTSKNQKHQEQQKGN